AVSFLINKSQGLKFIDNYKEEFTPTNYFSATKEQFYDNNYNPNEAQGLSDVSLVFIPTGKVANSFLKYIPNHLEKPLKYSNVNKISKQMKKRGWTEKNIREAMKTKGIPTTGKNGPATRYVHPKTGKSIVIDNKTNEIFHVSGEGFKYDY
ncbi:MAG: colicin E5-related ribonuclease, partial [Campylobacter hominis]